MEVQSAGMPMSESAGPLLDKKREVVQMKKQLGLLEGVAIILGIIFGSGRQSSALPNVIKYQIQFLLRLLKCLMLSIIYSI